MTQLTRRALYDLVWSKPMKEVASGYEISEHALLQICKKHRVPFPTRSYWMRVNGGQVKRKKWFFEIEGDAINVVVLTDDPDALPPIDTPLNRAAGQKEIIPQSRDKIVFSAPPEPLKRRLPNIHSAIRATAKMLRSRASHESTTAKAFGEGFCGIQVGLESVERAVSILDDLARSLATRELDLDPTGSGMQVSNGKDIVDFTLEEVTRTVPYVPTHQDLTREALRLARRDEHRRRNLPYDRSLHIPAYPQTETLRTGQLFLQICGYSEGARRKWADGKTQTVESLIPSIVEGIEILLASRKAKRERDGERDRQWKEILRRRELAKARAKREASRIPFVESIIQRHQEISRLKAWLSDIKSVSELHPGSSYWRMLEWAKVRIEILQASIDPDGIEEQLSKNKLFPALGFDELHDSMGDPGNLSYWDLD